MRKLHAPYLLSLLLSLIGFSLNRTFAQVSGTKPEFILYKHNSGPNGAEPVVQFDMLGEIKFNALAAVNTIRTGVSIRSFATGPVNGNNLPANLIFQTGAPALIDRMVITADGLVGIGTITPGFNLDVVGNTHTSGDFFGRLHMDENPGNPGPDTYLEEAYFENKSGLDLVAPNAARGGLLTLAPTINVPGATDHQLFFNTGGIYHRKEAANAANWAGPWEKLLTSEDINGTPNRVAKFTEPSKLGDSQLWDDGTNVGIATTTPAAKLDVNGSTRLGGNTSVAGNLAVSGNTAVGNSLVVSNNANIGAALAVNTTATVGTNLTVNNDATVGNDARVNGRLIVGNPPSTPGSHTVYVDGSIIATEVKVALQPSWPDYVFEANYPMPDLNEWEQFIQTNKHLPGVPSAATVAANGGIELGEMNRVLLEKVEELTLLLISQQKQLDTLKAELQDCQR
ncbi:MAG: hypothetical protein L6Q97_12760 [Thermoanaerobaculia bacterium]|nr:hypothetical protein [Thermoanaerobaculia bacterium]